MRNETIGEYGGRRVVLMDSISLIGPDDAGTVVVSGSHGGAISGAFAVLHPPALVLFNDAGGGKNDAGNTAVAMLDDRGIACATVSHATARIGDAEDAWRRGALSAVSALAQKRGLSTGQAVRDAVQMFTERSPGGRPAV